MFINFGRGLERVSLNTIFIQAFYISAEEGKYKVYALMNDEANIKVGEFKTVLEAERYMSDVVTDINIPF